MLIRCVHKRLVKRKKNGKKFLKKKDCNYNKKFYIYYIHTLATAGSAI